MHYIAKQTGWIAGKRVAAGEPVDLTPEQAKYEHVSPAPVAKKSAAKKRSAKPPQVTP